MKLATAGTARRRYRMTARARAAEATAERILDAAWEAFSRELFDQVTLQRIAEDAGVTVQTIIRRFGHKEALFEATSRRERERILADRRPTASAESGIRPAVHALVGHYEVDGRTMLNFLRQEDRFPTIAEVVASGREAHRAWVEEHCAPIFEGATGGARERLVTAAIAATDIYVWKLLRLDLGRDRAHVEEAMAALLEGLSASRGGS